MKTVNFDTSVLTRPRQWPTASRNTDPQTSHKAERKHTELGKRAVRARQVLELVCMYPGHTSGELSVKMWERGSLPFKVCAETPHKRLPELWSLGLVTHGDDRKCRDSGNLCQAWYPTAKGERENSNEHI